MVNDRKCLTIKMVIGIVAVLGICMGIKLVESKEEYRNKKVIVCLKKGGEFGEKYSADSILEINNIQRFYDYSGEKKTCLYSDYDGKIIEKNIITNLSREITFKNAGGNADKKQEELINNLKYMPDGQKVSFMSGDYFYIYDYEGDKVIERRKCLPDSWIEYQWQGAHKLYFIPRDEKWIRNLYMCENPYESPVYITKGIKSIVPGSGGEKIYGILDTVESYYGSGFETKHEIVEIDVGTGEKRFLKELNSENFILENADDEFLFYVEKFPDRKCSKVYGINLKNRQAECIYETYDSVIGIIIR